MRGNYLWHKRLSGLDAGSERPLQFAVRSAGDLGVPQSVGHIISSLDTGGAETMLLNVLAHTDRERWAPTVVSLRDRGTLGSEIERLGIAVSAIGLGRGWPGVGAPWRARQYLKRLTPDVLLGWMYHGNVAAWLLRAALRGRIPMVWNIQHTLDEMALEKPLTESLIHVGRRLSRSTARIIYSSRVSAAQHERLGYDAGKSEIIPNGFDTDQFIPSSGARAAWRTRLGVGADVVVIGRVGRYHPMKDYPTFLAAAADLRRSGLTVHFVLAGRALDGSNRQLIAAIRRAGIGDVVSLLGEIRPAHGRTAALDVACSASAFGEAFAGVVAAAMSCGVPCVATDVGDSSWVIGDAGTIVAPRNPAALAGALRVLVEAGPERRRSLGERARAHIRKHFSISEVVKQYEAVLAAAAERPTARQR